MSLTVKIKDLKTGKEDEGHIVKVSKVDEPFSYYTLEDGTELTMRTTVSQVVRILNKWDDKGNPIYSIETHGTMTITSPDNLRRKPENG